MPKRSLDWWASSGGPTSYAAALFRAQTIFRSMKLRRIWACLCAFTKARAPSSNKPVRTVIANSGAILPATRWNRCSPL